MNLVADREESNRLVSETLVAIARELHGRGWLLGTSGNLSAVLARSPLRLAITSSGVEKGDLAVGQILEVDATGSLINGVGRPSAETMLHLVVVGERQASAVIHTHSVWATVLSDKCAGEGGLALEGYEMLKGLEGVQTHDHREWLPIIENSQDTSALAEAVQRILGRNPGCHGFLLRRHGLYTWGDSLNEAKRHVEILEFLLEVTGRSMNGERL